MSIEKPHKHNHPETDAVPVDAKSPADRKVRAVAFAICALFSALVWYLLFSLF